MVVRRPGATNGRRPAGRSGGRLSAITGSGAAAEASPERRTGTDRAEQWSRLGTIAGMVVAIVVACLAPVWAIAWNNLPFPGFTYEQSLVVNGNSGVGWTGREAGLGWPQRLTRVAGMPVTSPGDVREILAALTPEDSISVVTESPDGSGSFYGAIHLMGMPSSDLMRLFVIPYLVGVAYSGIGLWVYRVRGGTRPGRALAFFCFAAAVVCMLLFDAATTHVATEVWTLSIALSAGAVLSLAMRFPVEWGVVRTRAWVLSLPYLVSLGLAVWGILALADESDPWAYSRAWGITYRYIGLSLVTFLGTTLYRALVDPAAVVRKQARVVLIGSAIAFTPVGIWLLAPLIGINLPFEPVLLLGPLVVFPLSVAVAIVRYRLLNAEMVLNRALLYGALTALLAGLFTGSITLLQKVFVAVTGEQSDVAIVLTTLITVSAITPIRTRLQAFLDRRLKKGAHDAELESFATEARLAAALAETHGIAVRFMRQAVSSLGAMAGSLNVWDDGAWRTVAAVGPWTGRTEISVPIVADGEQLAVVLLGPRLDGRPYAQEDADALLEIAPNVARVMRAHRAGGEGAVTMGA